MALATVQTAVRGVGVKLDTLGEAVARRTRLLREPRPEGVSGPPARLLLGELREFAHRIRRSQGADEALRPQPVMLLPGFFAHQKRMKPMYDALEAAGHDVEYWGLGYNFGPTAANFEFMMRRVCQMAEAYGEPVALVGWSLGGLYARELARRQPENVSRVITLGTPFSGNPRANNVWRAYQGITGRAVDDPPVECDFCTKPPVPTIALWSPRDGAIHPRAAAGWPGERDRAVAMRCTHIGFSSHPDVVKEVLRQLDA